MILTCDECHTRYLVPGHAIGPEGRLVRCSNCHYEWFQEPEGGRQVEEPPEDIEPIPESVKPMPDGSEVPAINQEDLPPPIEVDKGRIMGYFTAVVVFFLILGGLMLSHTGMTRLWPATMAFYDMLGVQTHVDGEDLIFEKLQASAIDNKDGVKTLTVEGNIVNLTRNQSKVPLIQASLISESGETLDSWLTEPDQKSLGPEEDMAFQTQYPDVPREVKEVNIRFVPGSQVSKIKSAKAKKDTDKDQAEDQAAPEEVPPAPADSHEEHHQ